MISHSRRGLQFHVMLDELLNELLPMWLKGIKYRVVVADKPAGAGCRIERSGAEGLVDLPWRPQSLFVKSAEFSALDADSPWEFREANPGMLAMTSLPEFRMGSCERNIMGYSDKDADAAKKWSRVLGRARRGLLRGAWAVGDDRVWLKSHRFSEGAYEFYRDGGTLEAIAGGVYFVPEPDREN